jgi:hypothetical protein
MLARAHGSSADTHMPYKYLCSDPTLFQIPMRCAVCDSEQARLFEYTQEHFPIPILYVSFHTRTNVVLPYCAYHWDAFQSRFRSLRIVQYALIVGFFGTIAPGFFLMENVPGKERLGGALFIIGVICLVALPITLIVRHFFYDAFFRHKEAGLQISSKHKTFIENLKTANQHIPPARKVERW